MVSEPVPEPSEYHNRRQVTYGEVYARALELGAWLRDQGVKQGERVALGGQNGSG